MQFKELAFVRLRREPKQGILDLSARSRLEELKQALRGLIDWSFQIERHELREVCLNYESKAIYNNGIIVRKQQAGDFTVEIVTSVPRDGCTITLATSFSQMKNYTNYTYEQATFQANPVPFFESIGYKVVLFS